MHFTARLPALTAIAMASSMLLSACGGGDASPPPSAMVPPTVSIADNVPAATATGDVLFTFTFSKDVGTSFTADDVAVVGGTKGAFTRIDGMHATLLVTPFTNSVGTIEVSVAAGKFNDLLDISNTAAASAQQAYNTVIPVLATTLVSFEESPAPTLTGFGGAEDATIVADPTSAGNKVAKVVKSASAELWAGTTVSLCPNNALVALPFSAANTKLTARVWSPDAGIPVRMKVENAADATKSVETEATTTNASGWQTLTFNFGAQVAGTPALNLANRYDKASIFFNFGKTGAQVGAAKTYYFDDMVFVGANFSVTCPSTSNPASGLISFDEATPPVLTGFGGAEDASIVADPSNSANKVAKIVKSATAELWAGTTISKLANLTIAPVAFSASNTKMTAKVWSPVANIPVRLKVENAADGSKSVETEATVTVANAWQTLTFDFAKQAAGTAALNLATTYNKVSIFFNFGKTGAAGGAGTYYLDDLAYEAGAAQTPSQSKLPVTFDDSTATYTLTGFGGAEDSSVVADPTNAANKVAKVVKAATAELWAGTTVSTGANQSIATIPFTASAKTMSLKVWANAAGIPVRLKVEDASDGTKSVETEAITTVAGGWQTLTFNFANPAAGTAALNLATTYNKASVFFNFGKTGAAGGAGTYYFDDLSFIP